MQELLKFPLLDQLVQMIPQIPTILSGVSLVLVVVAIEALITPHGHGISCHLVWPFEERLILNLLQYLAHWLSKHDIHCLGLGSSKLPSKVSPRSVIIVSV